MSETTTGAFCQRPAGDPTRRVAAMCIAARLGGGGKANFEACSWCDGQVCAIRRRYALAVSWVAANWLWRGKSERRCAGPSDRNASLPSPPSAAAAAPCRRPTSATTRIHLLKSQQLTGPAAVSALFSRKISSARAVNCRIRHGPLTPGRAIERALLPWAITCRELVRQPMARADSSPPPPARGARRPTAREYPARVCRTATAFEWILSPAVPEEAAADLIWECSRAWPSR